MNFRITIEKWIILLAVLLTNSVVAFFGPSRLAPTIRVKKGNLFIESTRNISLQADGSVNIQGRDLTAVIRMLELIGPRLNTFGGVLGYNSASRSEIQALRDVIMGSDGVLARITRLEAVIKSTNINDTSTETLESLSRKVYALEKRVTALRRSLTHNNCASNPCMNGASCEDKYNGFICRCQPGWEGSRCDVDINECLRFNEVGSGGCQNGATCSNTPGSYVCWCAPGFFGKDCSTSSNDCTLASSRNLCEHGTCINQPSKTGFKCICEQGWTTDPATGACSVDINECAGRSPPCSVDPPVPCINIPGSFVCGTCPAGFTGPGDYCVDIDECLVNNGGCSTAPSVQCINTRGSRRCGPCPPGYQGNGEVCNLSGLCSINNGGCHPLALCISATGSTPICLCKPGLVGSGIGPNGCVPARTQVAPATGACASNPCLNLGTCFNVGAGYTCSCTPYFTGPTCSERFSPCSSNPCLNGGSCIEDNYRSYRCECPEGYTGRTCRQQQEACGGYITQQSGELRFPLNARQYPHGVNCGWVITTNTSYVLNVTFLEFHLEGSANCNFDWLQIHDGASSGDHQIGRYCGTTKPGGGNIISTHNTLYLWFRSDSSISHDGFKLRWESISPVCGSTIDLVSHASISSPGAPGKYPANRDCLWVLKARPGNQIQLNFFSLQIESHPNCSYDYLEIREHKEPYDVLGRYCNTSHPAPLISPGNEVEIRFHSDAGGQDTGFQIAASVVLGASGCGGLITANKGKIQPPVENGRYLRRLDCTWKIQLPLRERVKIDISNFDVEWARNCIHDFLEIRDGADDSAPLLGRYCGTTFPSTILTNGNVATIHFHSDESINSAGFTLTYESTNCGECKQIKRHSDFPTVPSRQTSVCGGTFTNLNGTITSPFYPSPYPGSSRCIYQIEMQSHQIISLAFDDFDIERSRSCALDYLEVRDGDNANSTFIGKYCGDQRPEAVRSSTNSLYIIFRTDASVSKKGFKLNYAAIDLECGGLLKATTGIIEPPRNSEGQYRSNERCSWIIVAPRGHIIQFTWLNLHIEYSRDCRFDAVSIFDNHTMSNGGQLAGRYCGPSPPPPYSSLENVATVVFESDSSVNKDGFMLSYLMVNATRACGRNYTLDSGVLRSPNFPGKYPDSRQCVYLIRVKEGRQIRVNFTFFSLEKSRSECTYDYLEIRNGGLDRSPLIGKFCGQTIPTSFISFTNELYLRFVSDHSFSGDGFVMNWDGAITGCGGSLVSSTGTITSPNYPSVYGANADCYWSISTTLGSKLRIVFVDLQMEITQTCKFDYVEIWSGLPGVGKKIGRYCESFPEPITTDSNHLYIKFHSDVSYGGRGFRIDYSTVCTTNLTARHGIIESPGSPQVSGGIQCHWVIAAPRGSKVNVTFIKLISPSTQFPWRTRDFVRIAPGVRFFPQEDTLAKLELKEASGSDEPTTSLYSVVFTPTRLPLPPMITSSKDHLHVYYNSGHSRTIKFWGGGLFRLEWIVDGCGGEYRRPFGSFSTPNYPKAYPHNIECTWLIRVDLGFSIKLFIKEISLERSTSCFFDSLTIYGGADETAPLLTQICHSSSENITLTSSSNTMLLHFRSDSSYDASGFRATYESVPGACGGLITTPHGSIHSRNYPQNYDSKDDCTWVIKVDPGHVILFTINDLDLVGSSSNCTTTYLALYDGENSDSPELLRTCGNDASGNSTVTTGNVLRVRMKADGSSSTAKGFLANYTISCGARIMTNGSGVISSSEGTNMLGLNPNCSWIIISEDPSKHVTLTISYLLITTRPVTNNECDDTNRVDIHDGMDSSGPLIGSYCEGYIPLPITSRGSALFVHLVSPLNRFHGWFSAAYSVLSSYCGGTMKAASGTFASPGYPESYPLSMDCEWVLSASPGNRVQVGFRSFSLTSSRFCSLDFVEIRKNGPSGELIGTYCGDTIPSNLTAANVLWIKFRSSSSTTAPGFVADYSFLPGNLELTSASGTISSPLYPMPYFGYGPAEWRILVSNSKRIQLNFKVFSMDSFSVDCARSGHLEVFDGFDDTARRVLEACGNDLPEPITSSANAMFIKYETEYNRMGTKFFLEYLEVSPDTTSTETEGNVTVVNVAAGDTVTIKSPGYPKGYGENLNVVWVFETTQGSHLRLIFESLDVENNGFSDFVTVYTSKVGQGTWEALGKYFLANATEVKDIIAGTTMKVVFTTDMSVNGQGFVASVHAACGGNIFDPTGVIAITNTSRYLSARHNFYKDVPSIEDFSCEWVVRVAAGRSVRVVVTALDFPSVSAADKARNRCGNSYLMLKNGGETTSPLIGSYCSLPVNTNTSGNLLYVKFRPGSLKSTFELKYMQTSVDCVNDIKLTAQLPSMIISSPNYPNIPPPHSECIWLISVPASERVSLNFLDRFDLTRSVGCKTAAVEVRDGGSENANIIDRFCRDIPGTVKSTGSMMHIRFYTSTSDPKNGFKANVSIDQCGGTIRGMSGSVSSPGYPHNYHRNLNCQWTLVVPEYHRMILEFVSFEVGVETNPHRCSDWLVIDPVDQQEDNAFLPDLWNTGRRQRNPNSLEVLQQIHENATLGKFCGSKLPANLTSPSNAVALTLRTSPESEGHKGFLLRFTAEFHKCGGTLEGLSGSFQTLGYPNGISRHHCSWSIKVPSDRRVTLYFDDWDLSSDVYPSGVVKQRIIVYLDADVKIYWKFMIWNSTLKTLESSNNAITVSFLSSIVSANRGLLVRYDGLKPAICGGPLSREPTILTAPSNFTAFTCKWTWEEEPSILPNATTSKTLAVYVRGVFGSPASYPCSRVQFNVLMALGKTELYRICETQEKPHVLVSPYIGTSISITQGRFYNNRTSNVTMTYAWSDCGGVLKSPSEITSPRFPSKYPPNTDCAWAISFDEGQQIRFSTTAFDLKNGDYVRIYNGPSPKSPMVAEYTGNTGISETTTSKSSLWIVFHSDIAEGSSHEKGNGFKLKLSSVESVCGGILHDSTGDIASPNYPKSYGNNQECEWEIRSQDGYHIGLTFVERFHIEESNACDKDYIEIFDKKGDIWASLGKLCGRNTPTSYNSTGPSMKIVFHSDSSGTSEGFKARWNWNCGQEIVNSPKGYIISPGYPRGYTVDLECSYTVRYPTKHLTVQFEDFILEGGSKCQFDNVSLNVVTVSLEEDWNGDIFSVSETKGPYCGDTIPPPFRALGFFTLKFRSDGWIQKKGFKLKYSIDACNENITSPTEISSPAEDEDHYLDNLRCTWYITAPPGEVVTIKFTKIMVELVWKCMADSIVIYNGTEVNEASEVDRFCGNVPGELPTIKVGQNAVVEFITDGSGHNGGFKAFVFFTTACDKEIYLRPNEETSVISYSKYRPNDECHWKITTDVGYNLKVTIDSLTTSNCPDNRTSCSCEFVELRDGPSKYSDLIGRYCRGFVSSVSTTSDNLLWMRSSTTGLPNGVLRFTSKIRSVPTLCGTPQTTNVSGTLFKTFKSPGYPGSSPPYLRCSWTVSSISTTGYGSVKISFQDINLDGAIPCDDVGPDQAVLEVTRENSHSFGLLVPLYTKSQLVFCGNQKPPPLFKAYGTFHVLYRSGANPQPKAFQFTVTDIGCSGNYSDLSGFIILMERGPCVNYITAPSGNYTIALYFRALNVFDRNPLYCSDNALEVLDGTAPNSPRLAKLCGGELPPPIFSNSSSVTIRLVSAGDPSYNHIEMSYIATDAGKGCGGYVKDYTGSFTSPMYPQNYRKQSYCVWTIEMHGATVPYIKFNMFDLGPRLNSNCELDKLELFDVDNNGLELFRVRYCAGDTPADFRGNYHRVTVKYTSSVHSAGQGWDLSYAGLGTGESIPAVFREGHL